jgi:hypothetical protein
MKNNERIKSWQVYLPIQFGVMLFYVVMDWLIQFITNDNFYISKSLTIGVLVGWGFGVVGVIMFYENPRQKKLRKNFNRISKIAINTYDKDELINIYEDLKELKSEFGNSIQIRELESVIP